MWNCFYTTARQILVSSSWQFNLPQLTYSSTNGLDWLILVIRKLKVQFADSHSFSVVKLQQWSLQPARTIHTDFFILILIGLHIEDFGLKMFQIQLCRSQSSRGCQSCPPGPLHNSASHTGTCYVNYERSPAAQPCWVPVQVWWDVVWIGCIHTTAGLNEDEWERVCFHRSIGFGMNAA